MANTAERLGNGEVSKSPKGQRLGVAVLAGGMLLAGGCAYHGGYGHRGHYGHGYKHHQRGHHGYSSNNGAVAAGVVAGAAVWYAITEACGY